MTAIINLPVECEEQISNFIIILINIAALFMVRESGKSQFCFQISQFFGLFVTLFSKIFTPPIAVQ